MKGFGGAVLYDEATMVYECLAGMNEIVYNENEIDEARGEFVNKTTGKVTGNHKTTVDGIVPEDEGLSTTKGTKTGFVNGNNEAELE